MRPARFITFEGGEGAGKSTHARLLSQALKECGVDNIVTREPGGSLGAEEIRKLLVEGQPGRWNPLVETLLMFAARADHLEQTIKPALNAGRWVLCDRFTDSTFAYQGDGRGVDSRAIHQVSQIAVGDIQPDLTIILDIPVDDAMKRVGSRDHAENRFEKFDRTFHERLRSSFQALARREPRRCVLFDSLAPLDEVTKEIWRAVTTRLGVA